MDNFIKNEATLICWKELQEKEVQRAYQTLIELLRTPLTIDEFRKVWYSENDDKKGIKHVANMCMSMFQARKSIAGNSFEKAIEKIHLENGIVVYNQSWVDDDGEIYKKKPSKSVHKHDCLIPFGTSNNIKDMIVISKKTTLRERFREDLDSNKKCKCVIFLTRETPSNGAVQTITGYNCILVYPNAELTEHTWSYDQYILRMKHFQQTGSYTIP